MHTHKWLGETGQRKESERREIHSETEGNKERRGKINELKFTVRQRETRKGEEK